MSDDEENFYRRFREDDDNFNEAEDKQNGTESGDEDFTETIQTKPTGTVRVINRGDARTTYPLMTNYDYSRLTAAIARMYEAGLPLVPELKDRAKQLGIIDPLDLAELHVKMKIPCPIFINKPLPDGSFDEWDPNEMILWTDLQTVIQPEST